MPFESSAAAPQPTPFAPPTLDITVGSLISRTFGVWSHTMWKFLGFTVVLFLPVIAVAVVMGVGVAAGGGESLRGNPGAIFGGVAILVPLLLLAALVQMGGVTYGAIQELAGRQVRFGGMFSAGLGRALPLIGAGILVGLCCMLGLVLLIVPGVILGCGLSVTFAIVVAERLGPIEAMKRSWALTGGFKGTYFLAAVVLGLITLAINFATSLLGLIPILGQIAAPLIQLLFMSLSTILPAVAYHDLRTQKEGTPTAELAKVFE